MIGATQPVVWNLVGSIHNHVCTMVIDGKRWRCAEEDLSYEAMFELPSLTLLCPGPARLSFTHLSV